MAVLTTMVASIGQNHSMENRSLTEEMLSAGKSCRLLANINLGRNEVAFSQMAVEVIFGLKVAL